MISLDALRDSLLSDQPYTRLDALVRAELAGGRLTRQIHDELSALEPQARDLPGFDERAEEALVDTLDALVGYCPSQYAYRNPPVLPAEYEIAQLPRWARVAFAARCARRVLPLFRYDWRESAQHHLHAVQSAVAQGERSAASAIEEGNGQAANDASQAASIEAAHSAQAVATAARAAAYAHAAPGHVISAVDFATEAVRYAFTEVAQLATTQAIRRDFDHLANLAEWQHWDDDTPVPPEVFGPLWPEGPPAGWPADPDTPQQSALEYSLIAREQATDSMVEDEVVNLFNALNAYAIARTGRRLALDELLPYIPILARVEV